MYFIKNIIDFKKGIFFVHFYIILPANEYFLGHPSL